MALDGHMQTDWRKKVVNLHNLYLENLSYHSTIGRHGRPH
jgi:hypothetical protein